MPDLKQLILQNVVKPALAGIPPMVLARVRETPPNRYSASIEFRDFRHSESESPDEARKMIRFDNVRVAFGGVGVPALRKNDAVWVSFLGHDMSSPRIVAKAGQWNETLNSEYGRSPFEAPKYEETQAPRSSYVPNAASWLD